jgi:hypothetical protein
LFSIRIETAVNSGEKDATAVGSADAPHVQEEAGKKRHAPVETPSYTVAEAS